LEWTHVPKRGLISTGLTDRGQRIIKALATSALVNPADYWIVRSDLLQALKQSFDANGSPFPQQERTCTTPSEQQAVVDAPVHRRLPAPGPAPLYSAQT